MSTNYYWVQRGTSVDERSVVVHIGKRWSKGLNRGFWFTWAQLPHIVRAACRDGLGRSVLVVDEDRKEYTGEAFLTEIEGADDDLSLLGGKFS